MRAGRRAALLRLTWRFIQAMVLGAGTVWLGHTCGVADWWSVLIGVAVGLAVWRPPPETTASLAYQRQTALDASVDGLDLGRVVSAPSQPAPLFVSQPFWLGLDELQHHVTLIGTTGSGKTTTLGRLMDAALEANWPVVVVDAKGGRLANVCLALGRRHGLAARIWLPDFTDGWTYDLCAGQPNAVGNRLVGAFEHGRDGQIYRNLSQALVPLAVRALSEAGQPCTLDTLRFSLDDAHLAGLARRMTDGAVKVELVAMLQDPLHRKALSGLVGRLRALRYGVFGASLLPSDRTLDLAECLSTPGVTYLGLPATAASEDVSLVGRVLIQHLKQVAYAALWSDHPRPGLIVFDEFASLGDAVQLGDLLLQAREARLSVIVSTQLLPREETLRKALLGVGALLAHQVGAPQDAETMARALGARTATEVVRQVQLGYRGPMARRFLRNRESFVVSPDQLARLPIGQAAVCVRFGQQRIGLVQIDPLPLQ